MIFFNYSINKESDRASITSLFISSMFDLFMKNSIQSIVFKYVRG